MTTIILIVLAVLSYLGKSLVQLASVFGMALALWLTDKKPLSLRLAALVVGSLVCTLAAEGIHVAYHAREAAAGLGDPPHGGFWTSAVLVGLINCAVVAPVIWFSDRWTRARASDVPQRLEAGGEG